MLHTVVFTEVTPPKLSAIVAVTIRTLSPELGVGSCDTHTGEN